MGLEAFCRLSGGKPDGLSSSNESSASLESKRNKDHSNSTPRRNAASSTSRGPRMAILDASESSCRVYPAQKKRTMLVNHCSTGGWGGWEGATLDTKAKGHAASSSSSTYPRPDRAADADGRNCMPHKTSTQGHNSADTPAADCAPVAGFLQRMSKGFAGSATRVRGAEEVQPLPQRRASEHTASEKRQVSKPQCSDSQTPQDQPHEPMPPESQKAIMPPEPQEPPAPCPTEKRIGHEDLQPLTSTPAPALHSEHESAIFSQVVPVSVVDTQPPASLSAPAQDSEPEPAVSSQALPFVEDHEARVLTCDKPEGKKSCVPLSGTLEATQEKMATRERSGAANRQYIMSKLQRPVPASKMQTQVSSARNLEAPPPQQIFPRDPEAQAQKSFTQMKTVWPQIRTKKTSFHASTAPSCSTSASVATQSQSVTPVSVPSNNLSPQRGAGNEKATKMGLPDLVELNNVVLEYLKVQGVCADLLQTLNSQLAASLESQAIETKAWTSDACRLTRIFKYATQGVLEIPVSTLSGQTFRMDARPWTTVQELKVSIEARAGILANELRLVHDSVELTAKDQCLAHCLSRPYQAELSIVRIKSRWALTAAEDSVKLWNLGDGTCAKTLEGHGGAVQAISADWSQMKAICGTTDGALKVWDLQTGVCLETCSGHQKGVCGICVDWSNMMVLSAGSDCLLKLWDLKTGKCVRTMKGHSGTVWVVDADWKAQRALSGSADHTLRMWNLATGSSTTTRGHYAPVTTLAVSWPTMRALSGSGSDCAMKLWDIQDLSCLKVFYSQYGGHTWNVMAISVDWTSHSVLSGSGDGRLRIWDLSTGECTRTLKDVEGDSDDLNQPYVHALAVDWTSGHVLCAKGDNTLRVWDLDSGKCMSTLDGHHHHPANAVVMAQMDEGI